MEIGADTTGIFIGHVAFNNTPFVQKYRSPGPVWEDEKTHEEMYAHSPSLYALTAVHGRARENQKKKILFRLLKAARNGLDAATVKIHDRVITLLLVLLPADSVLEVFLALRRVRANHGHAARIMVRYILNHPCAADMAAKRRRSLVDILEHAMGVSTARECARIIAGGRDDEAYLSRNLLRHASSPGDARRLFAAIYGKGGEPVQAPGHYRDHHLTAAQSPGGQRSFAKTINAMNRGDIAATLVNIYRGGPNAQLLEALDHFVEDEAASLPRFDGTVAMILDASASTRGFGEREYSIISQSMALCLVMKKCAPSMQVYLAGGEGDPPFSSGVTDLALPLLDALEKEPDLAVIVSDGYENVLCGDLGRTVAAVREAKLSVPVVFCHSKFTARDDLQLRRPVENLAEFEFWHQSEFAGLITSLFAMAGGDAGGEYMKRAMERALDIMEKENTLWMR